MSTARDALLALPGVVIRRLATREGFFTAGRMFALLDRNSLLLRLPARTGAEAMERAAARRLVDRGVPVPLPWIELAVAATDPAELIRLAAASHEAVRLLRRRAHRSRSAARRRRRRAPRSV
jgi:hypothetical protein